jgi:hypothetical protein
MYETGQRYGIWGVIPQANDAVSYGLQQAGTLSNLKHEGLLNQALGIQNQWAPQLDSLKVQSGQLKNQYYPQDEAVRLANSLTLINRQGLQQTRFGDPMYKLTKWLNSQAMPVRTAWAQANPELYAQVTNRQFTNVMNPDSSPGRLGANNDMQAYNVLTPFVGKGNQPPAWGQPQPQVLDQQQPDPTQAKDYFYSSKGGLGNQPINNPLYKAPPSGALGQSAGGAVQPGMGATTQLNTPPPQPISGGTTGGQPTQYFTGDQIKSSTDNALSKELDTTSTINRQQAFGRLKSGVSSFMDNIDSFAKYQGLTGKAQLAIDAAKSALGHTPDDYQQYQNAQNSLDIIKSDLGPMLGKQATDQAVKDAAKILDFDGISSNPKFALNKFYNLLHTLQKTGEVNELPLGQQKAHPKLVDEINARPAHDWAAPPQRWMAGGQVYSDGKGNFYTRDEMNKLIAGKK